MKRRHLILLLIVFCLFKENVFAFNITTTNPNQNILAQNEDSPPPNITNEQCILYFVEPSISFTHKCNTGEAVDPAFCSPPYTPFIDVVSDKIGNPLDNANYKTANISSESHFVINLSVKKEPTYFFVSNFFTDYSDMSQFNNNILSSTSIRHIKLDYKKGRSCRDYAIIEFAGVGAIGSPPTWPYSYVIRFYDEKPEASSLAFNMAILKKDASKSLFFDTETPIPNTPGSTDLPKDTKETSSRCVSVLTQELIDFFNEIFNYIKIIVPIYLIILGSFDMIKAMTASDQKYINQAYSYFFRRLIAAVTVFFVPLLLNIILELAGFTGGTCGVQ